MTGALALNLSAVFGTAPMLVPDAPNVTVGTFCVGRMLYTLSGCDIEGGGSHLDGPWHPVESSLAKVVV
jgi:hypothetical protein